MGRVGPGKIRIQRERNGWKEEDIDIVGRNSKREETATGSEKRVRQRKKQNKGKTKRKREE